MTLKKVIRSLGAALLYFGIYMAWQFIVIFWATLGFTMVTSFEMGADMADRMLGTSVQYSYEDVLDASLELEEELMIKTSEWILDNTVLLTVISGILTLITYAVIFKMRKKKPLSEVGLVRMHAPHYLGMFLLGAALNIALSFLLPLLPFPEAWWNNYHAQTSLILDAAPWLTVLMTVIVAPLLEEVVFRGLVYTRLKRGMPMFAAMIISAWLFGLMHGSTISFVYASVFGFLLAWVFEKCGSLAAPILLHFGFNLCAVFIGEFSDIPVLVCLVALLMSAAIIASIQITSKNKLEFVFPKAENSETDVK